jgi:NAD(P)-dependent dehydrogenase (short-subunit alcohol dehydrogenase family)
VADGGRDAGLVSDPFLHRPRGGTAAVLTGATCGLGRELVHVLTRRDLAVVVAYLRDASAADAVVDEVLAAGGSALAVRADLTDPIDVERLFDETEAAFGAVDVVVHAAHAARPRSSRRPRARCHPAGSS